MNTIVKGKRMKWSGDVCEFLDQDVETAASSAVGVWLVDSDHRGYPFRMVIGSFTKEDAARAYARQCKEQGRTPPGVIRVFPLVDLQPISLQQIIDDDGDEEWSAFQNDWIEVRL